MLKIRPLLLLVPLLLTGCNLFADQEQDTSSSKVGLNNHLINFSNPNVSLLKQKFQNAYSDFNVVMLGDSHVAAQLIPQYLLTDLATARNTLATSPGWQPVADVNGQRSSRYKIANTNVNVISSSRKNWNGTEPLLGSFIAVYKANGKVSYTPYSGDDEFNKTPLNAQVTLRCNAAVNCDFKVDSQSKSKTIKVANNKQWSIVNFQVENNFTFSSKSGIEVGQLTLTAPGPQLTNHAIGVNGITAVSFLEQYLEYNWNKQLKMLNPDLIILNLGSNDSYNDNFEADRFKAAYSNAVASLKKDFPEAVILLVSTPEINARHTTCPAMRLNSDAVYQNQLAIAKANHLLFWDWLTMSGGSCSRQQSYIDGNSYKDGVHFTVNGSRLIATNLSSDLLKILK